MNADVKSNPFLDVIRNARKNSNLAFFIGSGFSSSENPKLYKSWNGLTSELKKKIDCDNETDNLKIAQMFRLKFREVEAKNTIRAFFPAHDKPGKLHQSLVNYNANYLITTNWDKLIDNSIRESLRGYDVIASDSELVESINRNKLIKMHGDFDHDNYVFTEQDYLDYSINFPLIENFVKSILSTHVCVLFGYSFNDIDFKQIVNWLKNNSKKQLPIYMISTSKKSQDECDYLKTFGIQNIQICNDNKDSKDSFISFFQLLEKKNYIDFLDNPEKFIYEKLAYLNVYPNILQSQIKESLTNCGFAYDSHGFVYLCFHDSIITTDSNNTIRELYKKFYDRIDEYEKTKNDDYENIKKILRKSDIHGFTLDSLFQKNKYKSFANESFDFYSKRFNFDFGGKLEEYKTYQEKLEAIFSLYSVEKYEEAFLLAKEELVECKLNKDYAKLIICLVNYNIILWQLKFNIKFGEEINNKYSSEQEIDIDNEYSKLPESVQEEIRPIFEFANFKYIYKEFFNAQDSLEEILKRKHIVFENSLTLDEKCGVLAKHKNLVDFIVNNAICVEDYLQYKKLSEIYFEISLINNKNNIWKPNKTILYTAIKYIKTKDLKDILDAFINKKLTIDIDNELHTWLIDVVLENCIQNYCNRIGVWSKLESYLENTLLLLSVLKNTKEQTDKILDMLNSLVKNTHNTLQVFDEINLFLGIQYNSFENKNIDGNKTLNIVTSLLRKFVSNNISGYEDFAITQNKLTNLLGCSSLSKVQFSDKDLLKKFLKMIEQRDISEQLDMSQGFILQLYCISDDNCKEEIKAFTKGNIGNKSDRAEFDYLANYYSFKIYLHLLDIEKLEDSFKNELEELINKYPRGTLSSRYNVLNFRLKQLSEKDNKYKVLAEQLEKMINDGIDRFNKFFGNKE